MNPEDLPNHNDPFLEDGVTPNPEYKADVTEQPGTVTKPIDPEAGQEPDYKKKFAESTTEAQKLLAELKEKEAEIERLKNEGKEKSLETELFPGFEDLDDEAKANLLSYTKAITQSVTKEVYNDPAVAFARKNYNEKKFDDALSAIVAEIPALKGKETDFKAKYFKANNVPDNIGTILKDVAKIYLFDSAKEVGALEERQKQERIEQERAGGGDKTPQAGRSLDDWLKMAQEDPRKFASLSKEYEADLKSGKI